MAIPNYISEPQDKNEQRVWRIVSHSPLQSLWHPEGATKKQIAKNTWKSVQDDRVFGRAAELGFYFFFALFPALFCAVSIFGLVAKTAHQFYGDLLNNIAMVAPPAALKMIIYTFNETTRHASTGKITFSLLGAIWSASVGISAVQDTLNDVYKIENTRSYLGARIKAIGLTFVVTGLLTLGVGSIFASEFVATWMGGQISDHIPSLLASIGIRVGAWAIAVVLLVLVFAVIYYWAPDWRRRRWRWITPGSVIGIVAWVIASLGLRLYLQYFNTYAVTYGSLGAVIILLTWFYITGVMLLVGAEINSEIEAASVRDRLANHGAAREPERAA